MCRSLRFLKKLDLIRLHQSQTSWSRAASKLDLDAALVRRLLVFHGVLEEDEDEGGRLMSAGEEEDEDDEEEEMMGEQKGRQR